jgi:hypothetical protein
MTTIVAPSERLRPVCMMAPLTARQTRR